MILGHLVHATEDPLLCTVLLSNLLLFVVSGSYKEFTEVKIAYEINPSQQQRTCNYLSISLYQMCKHVCQ